MNIPIIHINIDAKETVKHILAKITSGRFVMTVCFTVTYCLVILGCTYAMLKKILAVETAVALIAAFALIVREIADDYFKREDRVNENGKEPR